MPEIFANDLFEIHGIHIPISSITDYQLKEIEFIMRPIYYMKRSSKLAQIFFSPEYEIVFDKMDYYAAIIDEARYKNAVEDAETNNLWEAMAKTAATVISDVVSNVMGKSSVTSTKYRLMNPAGRVFERTLDEIPAIIYRDDGKQSEVFKNDELYTRLGEPIAPTIVTIPSLRITVEDGEYIFFGDGIQINNIEKE
ncbi:MAG: hypothetical protein IJX90_08525 [Blautia sp.]|nr:hypothetical protein [Blautia sp.]